MFKGFLLLAASAAVVFAQSPLTITTPNSLPAAIVNQPYAVQLSASGGATPYTWRFTANGNPSSRFSLSASGTLSGTPASADLGVLAMTIQVSDATGLAVAKQFSVAVQST